MARGSAFFGQVAFISDGLFLPRGRCNGPSGPLENGGPSDTSGKRGVELSEPAYRVVDLPAGQRAFEIGDEHHRQTTVSPITEGFVDAQQHGVYGIQRVLEALRSADWRWCGLSGAGRLLRHQAAPIRRFPSGRVR